MPALAYLGFLNLIIGQAGLTIRATTTISFGESPSEFRVSPGGRRPIIFPGRKTHGQAHRRYAQLHQNSQAISSGRLRGLLCLILESPPLAVHLLSLQRSPQDATWHLRKQPQNNRLRLKSRANQEWLLHYLSLKEPDRRSDGPVYVRNVSTDLIGGES